MPFKHHAHCQVRACRRARRRLDAAAGLAVSGGRNFRPRGSGLGLAAVRFTVPGRQEFQTGGVLAILCRGGVRLRWREAGGGGFVLRERAYTNAMDTITAVAWAVFNRFIPLLLYCFAHARDNFPPPAFCPFNLPHAPSPGSSIRHPAGYALAQLISTPPPPRHRLRCFLSSFQSRGIIYHITNTVNSCVVVASK